MRDNAIKTVFYTVSYQLIKPRKHYTTKNQLCLNIFLSVLRNKTYTLVKLVNRTKMHFRRAQSEDKVKM